MSSRIEFVVEVSVRPRVPGDVAQYTAARTIQTLQVGSGAMSPEREAPHEGGRDRGDLRNRILRELRKKPLIRRDLRALVRWHDNDSFRAKLNTLRNQGLLEHWNDLADALTLTAAGHEAAQDA